MMPADDSFGWETGNGMSGRRAKTDDTGPLIEAEATERGSNPSGALLRGLEVLQAFAPERAFLGNAEISAATGLPKPTVSRLTRALVEAGYLGYEPVRGKYQLRPRVLTLGFSVLSNMKVLPIAHEQLQRLATASCCAVSLAWPDTPHMIYLDRCTGEALPYFFSIGSAIDMARTATGRAYLASLDPNALEITLRKLAPHYPDDWQPLRDAIMLAVSEVAERGFCLVDTTWRQNIRGVAAPLVSRDGRTRMSINCVTPTFAMDRETLVGKWGPLLANTAQALSMHL